MKKYRKPMPPKRTRKPYRQIAGLPPGSLVHTGERKTDATRITLISYSEKACEEKQINLGEIPGPDFDPATVQWIHVEGLSDVSVLETIGRQFSLHSLVLEDILNTQQRPKLEDYNAYTYTVVKALSRMDNGEFVTEQQSFILGDGFLLSFSERDTDTFKPVIDRLKKDVGRIRKLGADYLLYSLLDVIVDEYFVLLEELGEKIENTEDELVTAPSSDTLKQIHALKRQMLWLHKAVWPFREVVSSMERGDTPLVKDTTNVYLRDLYDHVIQAMDITDTQRDILSSMLDIYLSSVSNRMNEIMKVLTIISTIFMPLSFIVGLYGMNLIMPETQIQWFYPALWAIIVGVAAVMLIYFKRRKWW